MRITYGASFFGLYSFLMKRFMLTFPAMFFYLLAGAQADSLFQTLVARASLFHLQKKHGLAIACYEKAFAIHAPDALTTYKAAGVYALAGNAQQSILFLQEALHLGWTEANQLNTDPYFDYLRQAHPSEWAQITTSAAATEKAYEKNLLKPTLRKQINQLVLHDQQLRYRQAQAENDKEREALAHQIHLADSANLAAAKKILRTHGWPARSAVGKDGQHNFWLLAQHADGDVLFQQNAIRAMEKLRDKKEVDPEHYAFLYDRVRCNLNYPQWYGTQVSWSGNGEADGFRRIAREDEVNKRRRALGLEPLEIYAVNYGFSYTPIATATARQQESEDLAATRRLIDSAKHYFEKKQFRRTYDLYNEASTIPGGMSNADNYAAAQLFIRIAAEDPNEQYRSIALDFLYLLYLRSALTIKELRRFPLLYGEARWQAMRDGLQR